MRKIVNAVDVAGHELGKGDTVVTLGSQATATIADLAVEGETQFVKLRPIHQPYGRGVWHAADCVQWLAYGRKRKAVKT